MDHWKFSGQLCHTHTQTQLRRPEYESKQTDLDKVGIIVKSFWYSEEERENPTDFYFDFCSLIFLALKCFIFSLWTSKRWEMKAYQPYSFFGLEYCYHYKSRCKPGQFI